MTSEEWQETERTTYRIDITPRYSGKVLLIANLLVWGTLIGVLALAKALGA